MPIKKKTLAKTFIATQDDHGKNIFFRAWQILNLDGPLCPLPKPATSKMSEKLERMRRQQVHVDEIKRLCHVPIPE